MLGPAAEAPLLLHGAGDPRSSWLSPASLHGSGWSGARSSLSPPRHRPIREHYRFTHFQNSAQHWQTQSRQGPAKAAGTGFI